MNCEQTATGARARWHHISPFSMPMPPLFKFKFEVREGKQPFVFLWICRENSQMENMNFASHCVSSSTLWADHSIGITRLERYLSWLSLNVSWGAFFSFVLSFVFFSRKLPFYGNFSVYFLILFTSYWLAFALKKRAFLSSRVLELFSGWDLAIHGHLVKS